MTGGHGSLRMSSVFVFFTVRSMSWVEIQMTGVLGCLRICPPRT